MSDSEVSVDTDSESSDIANDDLRLPSTNDADNPLALDIFLAYFILFGIFYLYDSDLFIAIEGK